MVKVVKQNQYTTYAVTVIENPLNILFNIPMSQAKTGKFPGADRETFVRSPGGKRKKITISIEVPLIKPVRDHSNPPLSGELTVVHLSGAEIWDRPLR